MEQDRQATPEMFSDIWGVFYPLTCLFLQYLMA